MSAATTIGFIGAGRMATALAQGFIQASVVKSSSIRASDVFPEARAAFEQATGGQTFEHNEEVTSGADVLFLAVKPAQVKDVLEGVQQTLGETLVVSIAAGISISAMEASAGEKAKIVRVMPNTPALVGAAACGYSLNKNCHPSDGQLVKKLLAAVGEAFEVKESLLDAVTGLSGSGPAYGYLMIEAMSDGGVAAGLPRDIATRLAAQTLLGAAKMTLETGMHPGELKDMVTSPAGTTIDGVHALEEGAFRGTVMRAVREAAERAGELGS